MPIFRYSGYTAEGKESSGTMEAEGVKDAQAKVRQMGLYPRSIELQAKKARKGFFGKKNDTARLSAVICANRSATASMSRRSSCKNGPSSLPGLSSK